MATELYDIIEYSACWPWYHKTWLGFFNKQCYVILSDYSHHPEKYVKNERGDECKDTDPVAIVEEDIRSQSIQPVCSANCVLNHIHRPNKKPKTKL